MTEKTPAWARSPFHTPVHTQPARTAQQEALTQNEMEVLRRRFVDSVVQVVVQAITGLFVPTGQVGGATNQLTQWFEDLDDWFNSLFGGNGSTAIPDSSVPSLEETWNAFWNGIFGTSATGMTPADVQYAADHVSHTANTALYNTETMPGFFNTPRILPAWIGSLSDEVAFDRASIDGLTSPPLGTLVLIPVKVTQDRTIDALKFGCAATSMTNLKIALYDCDETTGDLTKVLDLGDRKADLDLTYQLQTFGLVEAVGVQANEIYYIGVLQVGGSAAGLYRNALTTSFSDGFFPKNLGNTWTTTGITVLPTSIDVTEVAGGTRYWGALGTSSPPVVPPGLRYTDSFNRPDNATVLGSGWTIRSGGGGIVNNTPSAAFLMIMQATYNSRLTSPAIRVGFRGHASAGTSSHAIGVTLRGNGLGPCMQANWSIPTPGNNITLTIVQKSAYGSASTTRASTNIGSDHAVLEADWKFESIGNQYTVYRNGVLYLGWVDAAGTFPVPANATEIGLYNSGAGMQTMDDWYAEDI